MRRKGWTGKTVSLEAAKLGTRFFQSVPKPFPMAQVTGKIDSLSDANGTDDKGTQVKGSWEDEDNVEASCWKKQKGGR